MAQSGRNAPCDCGSGRKTKRCCGSQGASSGPGDAQVTEVAPEVQESRLPRRGLTNSQDQANTIREQIGRRLESLLKSGDNYTITLDLAILINGVAEQAVADPDPRASLEQGLNILLKISRLVPFHHRSLPELLTSISSAFRLLNLSPDSHLDLLWRLRETSQHALARAILDMELALVLMMLGRDEPASQRLAAAKRIIHSDSDQGLQTRLDIAIAGTSILRHDLDTARESLDRCLSRPLEAQDRARVLVLRGAHQFMSRNDTAALADYLEAERLFRSLGLTQIAATVASKRSFLLIIQNREDEAYAELTRVVAELESYQDDRTRFDVWEMHYLLARLAYVTGLLPESLSHCRILRNDLNTRSYDQLADLLSRVIADRTDILADLIHWRMMANLTTYQCYLTLADRSVEVPIEEMPALANAVVDDLEFIGDPWNALAALEAMEQTAPGIPTPPESIILRLQALCAGRKPLPGNVEIQTEKLHEAIFLVRDAKYSEAKTILDRLLVTSGEPDLHEPHSVVWRASLLAHRSTVEFHLGNPREALEAGLASLALLVARRSGFRFEDMRNSSLTLAGTTRVALLFKLAYEHIPYAMAELIETVRGQVKPIREPMSWPIALSSDHGLSEILRAADSALTHLPVSDLSFVSVAGQSVLARYDTNVPVNDFSTIFDEPSRRAWLGYRRVGDDFYGSIVTARGARAPFRLDGREVDDAVRHLINQLPTPLTLQGRTETSAEALERAFEGSLTRSDSERQLMESLGEVLVPAYIWTVIQEEEIEEVLIAPDPHLRSVPWALLRSPEGRPLASYCGPALVPPLSVCAELATDSEVSYAEMDLRALIVGDEADLYWARQLSGSLDMHGGTPEASDIFQYFPDRPGESGVIVFACHVAGSSGLASSGARLQLSGGSSLSATQLLVGRVPSWARVLLAGCSSSGVKQGAAEWWGLPVAFLYGGADSVVSTAWDLPDAYATMKCDAEIGRLLTMADRPTATLRSFSMKCLMDWQADPSQPSPIFFGSYCVVAH
jgi:tetratricopeptide (TPR) repeat protein